MRRVGLGVVGSPWSVPAPRVRAVGGTAFAAELDAAEPGLDDISDPSTPPANDPHGFRPAPDAGAYDEPPTEEANPSPALHPGLCARSLRAGRRAGRPGPASASAPTPPEARPAPAPGPRPPSLREARPVDSTRVDTSTSPIRSTSMRADTRQRAGVDTPSTPPLPSPVRDLGAPDATPPRSSAPVRRFDPLPEVRGPVDPAHVDTSTSPIGSTSPRADTRQPLGVDTPSTPPLPSRARDLGGAGTFTAAPAPDLRRSDAPGTPTGGVGGSRVDTPTSRIPSTSTGVDTRQALRVDTPSTPSLHGRRVAPPPTPRPGLAPVDTRGGAPVDPAPRTTVPTTTTTSAAPALPRASTSPTTTTATSAAPALPRASTSPTTTTTASPPTSSSAAAAPSSPSPTRPPAPPVILLRARAGPPADPPDGPSPRPPSPAPAPRPADPAASSVRMFRLPDLTVDDALVDPPPPVEVFDTPLGPTPSASPPDRAHADTPADTPSPPPVRGPEPEGAGASWVVQLRRAPPARGSTPPPSPSTAPSTSTTSGSSPVDTRQRPGVDTPVDTPVVEAAPGAPDTNFLPRTRGTARLNTPSIVPAGAGETARWLAASGCTEEHPAVEELLEVPELPELVPAPPDELDLEVADPEGPWRLEVRTHAGRVDLTVRGDAAVHTVVRDAEPELRARLAESTPLGQLHLEPRGGGAGGQGRGEGRGEARPATGSAASPSSRPAAPRRASAFSGRKLDREA